MNQINQDDKSYIQFCTTSLWDKIDELRIKSADNGLIKLLERVANIGSTSILNYETLSLDEINNIKSTLSLCDILLNPKNEEKTEENSIYLERVVSAIEALFRNKRLLLDREEEKTI